MQWPSHFPESCPPEDSKPASGKVYRVISGEKPEEKDFKSLKEFNPQRNYQSECKACGLSVFTDQNDVQKMQNRVPGRRNQRVASGALNPSLGKILHTPSYENSHHSWWVPVGAQPWNAFSTVPISQD